MDFAEKSDSDGEQLGVELAQAVVKALGEREDPRCEPVLLKLLAHSDGAVRRTAAVSLGLVGTIRAVEPLLPLTQGLLTDGELKRAAFDSIRRIQAPNAAASCSEPRFR